MCAKCSLSCGLLSHIACIIYDNDNLWLLEKSQQYLIISKHNVDPKYTFHNFLEELNHNMDIYFSLQ